MAIELRVVQFWSEIIFANSNRTRAACLFDFEITRMISDQFALHSVQLPLFIASTRAQKAKLTVNFLALPSVKFRETWQTGRNVLL